MVEKWPHKAHTVPSRVYFHMQIDTIHNALQEGHHAIIPLKALKVDGSLNKKMEG